MANDDQFDVHSVNQFVGGDVIQQYGSGNVGKQVHTGSGDNVAGHKLNLRHVDYSADPGRARDQVLREVWPQDSGGGTWLKNRRVFVVNGRNTQARDAMFEFLRSIDLQPIEWVQAIEMTGKASPYIGEVLSTALVEAQAIVVLMTPDEITYLRPEYSSGDHDIEAEPAAQARPNVFFEAGMAMGDAPDRTVLVELGKVRPFSDIAGRHALRVCNTAESRKELVQRLKAAGCAVDTSGNDWLKAGDFRGY